MSDTYTRRQVFGIAGVGLLGLLKYMASCRTAGTVTPSTARPLNFPRPIRSVEDGLGNVTMFGYESIGRLTSRRDPVGRLTSYTYYTDGSQVQMDC